MKVRLDVVLMNIRLKIVRFSIRVFVRLYCVL